MKILYFYQYYSTPNGSWGTRVHEFARRWVEQGHEVTVVSSIYDKSDLRARRLVEDQEYDGVKVKVLNILISNKQPLLKRLWTFVQYSLLSTWYALTLPADVVIASSGPITVGIPGLAARYLRGRRLVFEVRDLWPEGIIQLGILKNPLARRLAYWLERKCYQSANLIVTLSPGMADWIYARYGFTHAIAIPNACDNELFGIPTPKEALPEWAKSVHYALYTGNIGQVNNSGLLLKAARLLQARHIEDIHVVLIGEGQVKQQLKEEADSAGLINIHFLDLVPKTTLVPWVQHALCSLVPLKSTPILDTSSPNKLFDSLAAGVPVIQTTQGWIRDFIDQEGCGYTIAADDAETLVDYLLYLRDHPNQRMQMCLRAHQLSRNVFDRDVLAQKMIDALEMVGGFRLPIFDSRPSVGSGENREPRN